MITYPYTCDSCGLMMDIRCSMDNRDSQMCPTCGHGLTQDYSRKRILVDQTIGKYDEQLGCYVESSSDKRRILKEKGLCEMAVGDRSYVSSNVETTKSKREKTEKTRTSIKKAMHDANNGVKPKAVATP